MFSLRSFACLAPLLLSFWAGLPAQKVEVPRVEREAKPDADGLLQWTEWTGKPCVTCKRTGKEECKHCWGLEGNIKCLECGMTKVAPCRVCGGSGEAPDPLELVVCAGCRGEGCFPCYVCSNEGYNKVAGGGSKPQKCPACKEDGGYECGVCDGARLVPGAKLKPDVAEAGLEELEKARAAIDEVLESLQGMKITGKFRKDAKAFADLLKPGQRYFPVLKDVGKMTQEIIKRMDKANMWAGTADMQALAIKRFATSVQLYMFQQQQVLDLCIARAKANAELLDNKNAK